MNGMENTFNISGIADIEEEKKVEKQNRREGTVYFNSKVQGKETMSSKMTIDEVGDS